MSEVARMRLGAVAVLLAPLVAVVGQSVLPIFDAIERGPAFAAAAATLRRGACAARPVSYSALSATAGSTRVAVVRTWRFLTQLMN